MLLVSMRELACVIGEHRLGGKSVLVTGEQSFCSSVGAVSCPV